MLLGQRLNRPAQGFWFVPGGRIRKDETMAQAFTRLAQEELGLIASGLADATFLGPYEHFYDDNFCNENFSTHYVVLGYKLIVDLDINVLPNDQHKAYRWLSTDDLLAANDVHINTKFIFRTGSNYNAIACHYGWWFRYPTLAIIPYTLPQAISRINRRSEYVARHSLTIKCDSTYGFVHYM